RVDAPDIGRVACAAVDVVARIRRDVVSVKRLLVRALDLGVLPRREIDLIDAAAGHGARDGAPGLVVDARARYVDHLAAAGWVVKLELLGLRIEDDHAALRLIADIPPTLSIGAHQRA